MAEHEWNVLLKWLKKIKELKDPRTFFGARNEAASFSSFSFSFSFFVPTRERRGVCVDRRDAARGWRVTINKVGWSEEKTNSLVWSNKSRLVLTFLHHDNIFLIRFRCKIHDTAVCRVRVNSFNPTTASAPAVRRSAEGRWDLDRCCSCFPLPFLLLSLFLLRGLKAFPKEKRSFSGSIDQSDVWLQEIQNTEQHVPISYHSFR